MNGRKVGRARNADPRWLLPLICRKGSVVKEQIGKIQITGMLADARRAQGSAFSLLAFNDFVWNNGNVPLSLQRWELLQDPIEVP